MLWVQYNLNCIYRNHDILLITRLKTSKHCIYSNAIAMEVFQGLL